VVPAPKTILSAVKALLPERVTGFVNAFCFPFQVAFSPVVTNDKSVPEAAAAFDSYVVSVALIVIVLLVASVVSVTLSP